MPSNDKKQYTLNIDPLEQIIKTYHYFKVGDSILEIQYFFLDRKI